MANDRSRIVQKKGDKLNEGLEVLVLGGLEIRRDGRPISGLASRKAEGLVAYLACAGRALPRTELATLLWDDRSEAGALGNLRVLLTSLRQALNGCLTITRDSIELIKGTYRLDVAELEQQVQAVWETAGPGETLSRESASQLAGVLTLYRGDFLQGFFLREALGFEEWALMERERLRQLVGRAHHALVDFYLNTGDYKSGIDWSRRLLALDPLRESAHRQMMMLLARDGQLAAALAQYETCQRVLTTELSIEPDVETQALYERLKGAGSSYRHNLPPQITPFIGRESDLAQVAGLLAEGATQLVTLVGPGGIGKTRLALQAASEKIGAFLHGLWYVPLVGLSAGATEATLAAAIAAALNLTATGRGDLTTQLLSYLRDKELLLVLDNFEHIIESAGLLAEIMASCPQVKLLATSRERLNLFGEWVVEVDGLSLPPTDNAPDAETHSAVQLFVQTAQRASGRFKLTAVAAPAVVRIGRLVGGMPLAIELAAAWVRTMSVQEIADAIRRDMNFLASSARGLAERHQSLTTVFEHSWRLLSSAEQEVFRRLSVFQGTFRREAALQIAGASAAAITGLVDKSLLRPEPGGRFVMHPVLHQFATARFADDEAAHELARRQHAQYYLRWMGALSAMLIGPEQYKTLETIAPELDNVRAAFRTALPRPDIEIPDSALEGLYSFYEIRGHYVEAERIFSELADVLETHTHPNLQALALAWHGWFQYRLSRYPAAEAAFRRSLKLTQSGGDRANESFVLAGLGYVSISQGAYGQAHDYLERSLAIAREQDNLLCAGRALTGLGAEANAMGRFKEARQFHAQALAIHQTLGDQHRIAVSYTNLGSVSRALGEYDSSRRYYEMGLAIRRELKDLRGIALTLNNLANVYGEQADYASARRLHEESLGLYREIGDVWGQALSLHNLGDASQLLNEPELARRYYLRSLETRRGIGDQRGITYTLMGLGQTEVVAGTLSEAKCYFKEALELALELRLTPLVMETILRVGQILAREGRTDHAFRLGSFVAQQKATEKRVRAQAEQFCDELKQGINCEIDDGVQSLVLEVVLEEVQAVLDSD